jgi:hypothetical protein
MLVSLADMKAYLGIVGTSDDTFLTEQLTLVSEAIENYCGRIFNAGSYVQRFYREEYPNDFSRFKTAQYPIKTITSIEADGVAITDFRFLKPSGQIFRNLGQGFFGCADELVVTYDAGFDTIPGPLSMAVKSIVEERYNKKKAGISLNFGSDVQSVSIPGTISVQFDYTLEANSRARGFGALFGNFTNVIDRYRSERAVLTGENEYVD